MKLHSIEAGNFKLDGGAMFGVVPKSLWERTNPADSKNLIDMASRCLLIEDGDKLTLVDTGMGNKQDERFFSFYYQWGDFDLDSSLKKAGFHRDEITDVILTHLHFDHCGGATRINESKGFAEPSFPNAKIWSNKSHWHWASEPNIREKPSFRKDNLNPIEESGQLHFVNFDTEFKTQSDFNFEIFCADGHTEKQMIPIVKYKEHTIAFAADLIPTAGHIPVVYTMGYDTRPLLTMEEKEAFLNRAVDQNMLILFEHDAHHELCSLKRTEKGIRAAEFLHLTDL